MELLINNILLEFVVVIATISLDNMSIFGIYFALINGRLESMKRFGAYKLR